MYKLTTHTTDVKIHNLHSWPTNAHW